MTYKYVKYADPTQLSSELHQTELAALIVSVNFLGGVISVETSRNLTKNEETLLYDAILAHVPPPMALSYVESRIRAAADFGHAIMVEFAARNVLKGISLTEVKRLTQQLGAIQLMLMNGSLYTALDEIQKLTPQGSLTQKDINYFSNKIRNFLIS